MSLNNSREEKIFASILSDGLIHITVDKETPGAKLREFEKSDGTKSEKYELVYTDISGVITKVDFYEGDYGTSLQLTIEDGDDKPIVLSLGTHTNFGEDMMKKLPNIDIGERVKLVPFSFLDDNGKSKKGITVIQNDKKVQNYFYDPVAKTNINGYPNPKVGKKPFTKDQWKAYFLEARIFLTDFIKDKFSIAEKGELEAF